MAKKRRRKLRRVVNTVSNRRLPQVTLTSTLKMPKLRDQRRWRPGIPPAVTASRFNKKGRKAPLSSKAHVDNSRDILSRKSPYRAYKTTATAVFSNPLKEKTCVQRKTRIEIMHALKKAGKKGQKRPKITKISRIRCK